MSAGKPAVLRTWVLGEFPTPETLLEAGDKLRQLGYKNLDAYSPFPIHGVEKALGLPKSIVPVLVMAAGIGGALGGFAMQAYCNGIDWPLNIGGRPSISWPAFIPITFECGVLLGALTAFLGVFALSGLPRPYHPVFEAEAFRSASLDRFWVSVALDGKDGGAPETDVLKEKLKEFGAEQVTAVEETAT